jgi:uncharacterized protein
MRTDTSLMNTPTTLMNRIETPDSALSSSSLEALSSSLRTSLASRAQNKKGAKLYSSMKISNLTRETVLARHVEVADRASTRRKGLLGRNNLPPGDALWIVPCESVHTLFMRFSIDIVYLDRNLKVRKVRSNVPPWRLSACLSAHSVVELASGTIQTTRTRRGDQLEFSANDCDTAQPH